MTYIQQIQEKVKEYKKELTVHQILNENMYDWNRSAVKRAEIELKEEVESVQSL